MSWPPLSLHLVGDATSPRAEAARTAGLGIRLGATTRHSPTLAAAVDSWADGPEVLILIDPTPEDFKIAVTALDRRGLPRWAVVPPALGPEADLSSASPWDSRTLACSIAFAVSLCMLRRDNARLSGDLYTVARRLTHDLRTPLNSISTANEALAAVALAGDPAPALHRAIAGAVDETGRLIDRVASLLLAAARPLAPEAVDMGEVVWNARERLDARIRAAGATIISPEMWPVVNAVPSWLELVWTSFLSNSVDHGGSTPRIELGWKRSDVGLYFWLRDSGPGVAIPKRAHLFHPFDRLNELNAPRGYGLSLVHRLIELQGGTTGYAPAPAPGGTFFFTLPEQTEQGMEIA